MAFAPAVDALITVFGEEQLPYKEGSRFAVSRTVSLLAALYEKARNAIEFRADHLIRRAATERILKRRIIINGGSRTIADNLVVELLWARYIDSSQVDDEKVLEVGRIIDRYLMVKHEQFDNGKNAYGLNWDIMLGLASSEIEETLVPARKRQALNNFFYQVIRPNVQIPGEEKLVNMQTYIAVERAFAQADDALIAFHLIKMIQPTWLAATADTARDGLLSFLKNVELIRTSFKHPLNEGLYRYVRKQTPPFFLIRDFFLENGKKSREIVEKPEELEQKLRELATKRYQEIGAKVRRSVVRSIIYIFFTKMLFALALEGPFDAFIAKKISYLPLAINTLFPPILLYLVAGFLTVPGQENTDRLIARINKIFYHFEELKNETSIFIAKRPVRRPLLTAIFSVFYLATFLISFGFITWVLTQLHFNIASQIIFVFFVTLVSFFAYRIRQSAKEYEIVDRQGFLTPVVDFFFLPILRVGHILSNEIAKLNIFIFLFDFILEAPLKVIFEVIEEWIRFIRTKKEEII